jgi:hypothetical protein
MSCRFRLLVGVLAACALASAEPAAAQDKSRAPKTSAGPKRKPEPEAKSKASKRRAEVAPADAAAGARAPAAANERRASGSARSDAKPQPARAQANERHPTAAPPPLMAADDLAGNVRSEGGTEVKALEFSGLDIEGQLKSPQMLYFLKRVRAEFEHPRLPHRSFMPELARSVEERDF